MTDTRTQLLDCAEAQIRQRGYHAVSFRELADALGIKSASVHYYFPQKEDLGLALVERYRERFFSALNDADPGAAHWQSRIAAFRATYRAAFTADDRICLCGMLGAESGGLPPRLAQAVGDFFQANIQWLTPTMDPDLPPERQTMRATAIVSALQGAMMLAVATGDLALFDRTLDGISEMAGAASA